MEKNVNSNDDWTLREIRQKFYTSEQWRSLREYKLSLNPFCEVCKANGYFITAEVVHHKIDIVDNSELRLDVNNLQSLCKKCHNRQTMKVTRSKTLPKIKGEIKRIWKI